VSNQFRYFKSSPEDTRTRSELLCNKVAFIFAT
jgi:hypothetical protein